MNTKVNRRSFLKRAVTVALGFVLAPSLPTIAGGSSGLKVAGQAPLSQIFETTVRNNLFDPPKHVELQLGVASKEILFRDSSAYRLTIFPTHKKPVLGNIIYKLVLSDAKGRKLDEMNVGSNTTATFRRFGVQVYILSVQL
jgi:hypothetical protein